jgi:hypothetical protein
LRLSGRDVSAGNTLGKVCGDQPWSGVAVVRGDGTAQRRLPGRANQSKTGFGQAV